MSSEFGKLSLSLKNDLAELVRISDAIDAFAEQNAVSMKDTFGLQLSVEELFTNIVSYGFEDSEEHEICIEFELDADSRALRIAIVDDGRHFDPTRDSAQPSLDSDLEDRPIGGLGIHLVREFADEMEYDLRDGRNHLTLKKNLS